MDELIYEYSQQFNRPMNEIQDELDDEILTREYMKDTMMLQDVMIETRTEIQKFNELKEERDLDYDPKTYTEIAAYLKLSL